ncbi:hypothetical protein BC941DRAFT_472359 [Chlamydoabsidia padenii]|nr:hypothetical protein BC941DRAFT_472359 [Chlamydoabsidia padenii]
MPFDTVGQCNKRNDSTWMGLDDSWLPDHTLTSIKPEQIDLAPNSHHHDTWTQDDDHTNGDDNLSLSTCSSWSDQMPTLESLHMALSRFRLSFTETGINMEANVSTASDLRSLLDAFSKLSCTSPSLHNNNNNNNNIPRRNSVVLNYNQSCKSAPVNHFIKVGLLGNETHQSHPVTQLSLRQIADQCVDTYFKCWVRYPPVLRRHDFMLWYASHPAPEDTLIVNALCSLVFRHAVIHHNTYWPSSLQTPDRIYQQEEFFFARARDALAQSLFSPPDRFMVIALTFLCVRTDPSKRHHYGGLAVSLLQQLGIYPRMIGDDDPDDDDYELEWDTRLWWYVWQIDLLHWSAGHPKITPLLQHPNQRYDQVDLPKVFDQQDSQDTHIAIIAQSHALALWRIQTEIISTLYEQEAELTSEQLVGYNDRLVGYYTHMVPDTMKTPSDDHQYELARIRTRLEYDASLIILHQLFTPDHITNTTSPSALASLKICLDAALDQLDLLEGCTRSPLTRCAFDLCELRRVGYILSIANLKRHVLEQHLQRSLAVLSATPEGQMGNKGWTEVAMYLHAQQPKKIKKKKQRITSQQQLGLKPLTDLSSALSIISFSHKQQPQQQRQPPTPPTQTFVQATCNTFDGTNQPRFRYFNPRKMNKFLFIDESR